MQETKYWDSEEGKERAAKFQQEFFGGESDEEIEYKMNARARELKKQGHEVHRRIKIGRNDPCPCGSGKKFKFCCIDQIR
jgi:uncharacterized protein YecA (UPF0149 family)